MATIRTAIELQDNFTNILYQVIDSVNLGIAAMDDMNRSMGESFDSSSIEAARDSINQATASVHEMNAAFDDMSAPINRNIQDQERFNQEISDGARQGNELVNTIKRAAMAYISIQSIGKVLNISDELTMTTARLDIMNDGMQSTEELVNMVYAAAQDARGSFAEMADVIARFGNNAGDAFSSSEEVVAFAGLVQKQMTIAGASTQESSNAMLQLSQALGSGVLRGDELNSIFEQAPNLIQSIADYLGVPIGQIREMASEGVLSADIVKAAVFASADEINARFNQMPMTWGQVWQSMQNTALMAFQPVLQRLNNLANSEAFQIFVNSAIESMAVLANIVLNIFDLAKVLKLDTNAHPDRKGGAFFQLSGAGLEGVCRKAPRGCKGIKGVCKDLWRGCASRYSGS